MPKGSDQHINVPHSLSSQVKNLILESIRSGEFAPGQKIPTERELCERCGVSRITVRAALLSLANEGVLRRRAGSGTYVNESMLHTGTIAFIRCQHSQRLHEIKRDFIFSEVLEGIQSELAPTGIHLIFSYIQEEDEHRTDLLETLRSKVDGLILGEMRSSVFYHELVSRQVPFVLINPEFSEYVADTIDYDNLAGSMCATEYLISLGHRAIGFINGRMPTRHAAERLSGYRSALEKHGIPFSPALVAGGIDWQSETGHSAVLDLLKRVPSLTAIFAANDSLAIGAIKAVHDAGRKVPEDISVLGFDDMVLAAYSEPALTTMRVDRHAMGKASVQRLMEVIRSPQNQKIKTLFIPELIKRDSCAQKSGRANG